jgi:hypothetical protein
MIGHYLLTLTEEQEDRVLTTHMSPGHLVRDNGTRCLLGVCEDWRIVIDEADGRSDYVGTEQRLRLIQWPVYGDVEERWRSVPWRFDLLCRRFSMKRINAAIRNRILSNRARRTLKQVEHPASLT